MNPLSNSNTTNRVYFQNLTVSFDYPVHFTEGLFKPENPVLAQTLSRLEPQRRHRCLFVIDQGVADHWPDLSKSILDYGNHYRQNLEILKNIQILPGGEALKNDPKTIETLYQLFTQNKLDRHSFVIVIGGGSLLDAVGYATATAHRGIRLVRIPTTVLAQNDSGIGVKTGMNFLNIKNFLGTFTPPFAVLNDINFTTTLDPRDKRAGMAEAIKVALIRDASFFNWIEDNTESLKSFELTTVAKLIAHCAELHLNHIGNGGDPFESGNARPLDFGHWSAHKMESLSQYQLRHGEAVALGMALDCRYCVEKKILDPADNLRICNLLNNLGFALWHPVLETKNKKGDLALLEGIEEFRQHLGGELTITLLISIGSGQEFKTLETQKVRAALNWLKENYAP